MKVFEAPLLALGGLLLSMALDIAQIPPARGMRGIVNDPSEYPVKMSGQVPPCPGIVLAAGTLDQTDHGALEGYFAVGQGFDGMMPPANPRYHWVKQYRDKNVEIVLRVQEPRQPLEIIK